MSVINFNTAKYSRRTDKTVQRILRKQSAPPAKLFNFPKSEQSDFRLTSEFVYKTVPLGITPGGACVVRTHLARKPLRLIVARTPVRFELKPKSGYFLTYYTDVLSCGHQVTTYSIDQVKKRRGCQLCLDALAIPLPEKKVA